MQKNENKVTYG